MSDRQAELKIRYMDELNSYYKELSEQLRENPSMFAQEEVTPEIQKIRTMIDNHRRPASQGIKIDKRDDEAQTVA